MNEAKIIDYIEWAHTFVRGARSSKLLSLTGTRPARLEFYT